MAKMLDRLLLFLFSLVTIAVSALLLGSAFNWIGYNETSSFWYNVYTDPYTASIFIASSLVVMLISIRLFYISVRSGQAQAPSIDQRNDYGDIRISIETVENLALKAAARTRGLKDLRARVRVSSAGLEIIMRTLVDGETAIPALTEEVQTNVKAHIEEITGIPVAVVSVFIANVVHSQPTFKSRVE